MADDIMTRAHDTAEDYGKRGMKQARRGTNDMRGELSRLWSQLEDLVEDNAGPARDTARYYSKQARYYGQQGRELAEDASERLASMTRSQPLLVLGVAVAATWLIASMMRRR